MADDEVREGEQREVGREREEVHTRVCRSSAGALAGGWESCLPADRQLLKEQAAGSINVASISSVAVFFNIKKKKKEQVI